MNTKRRPFIANFAIEREQDSLPSDMLYDENENVTMVKMGKRKVPVVTMKNPIVEMMTKTAKPRESDDFSSPNVELSYKATKTGKKLANHYNLAELETKTFAERESDDLNPSLFLMDLLTKTKQEREGDDIDKEIDML